MKDTAVILLASGLSTRFGRDKLMSDLCGKPVMMHAAEMAAALPFATHYAVIGNDPRRGVALAYAGYSVLTNPQPSDGQGSSIAIGAAQALRDGFSSVLIMLADMPMVDAAHINALIARGEDAVMSDACGIVMPPALFRRQALTSLAGAIGDKGASRALKSAAYTVPISADAALDIDTPADLSKVTSVIERDRRNG